MSDNSSSIDNVLIAFGFVAVVGLLLPSRGVTPSAVVAWLVYLVVYVPSIITSSLQDFTSFSFPLLAIALSISMLAIAGVPRLFAARHYQPRRFAEPSRFWFLFLLVYAVLSLTVFLLYRDHMSLVGIDDVYEQRGRVALAGVAAIAGYFVGFLGSAMNPFLIATGIFDGTKRWMLALGIAGQVMIFSIFAGKIVVAGMLVTIAFGLFAVRRDKVSIPRVASGFVITMLVSLAVLYAAGFAPFGASLTLLSILFMRTFAIQGAMTGVYADYFEVSQLTYFSHINVINYFIDYPYDVPLGYVVGIHLVGGHGFNANANFWATDGIAALGLVGIIPIGILFGLLLTLFDRVVPRGHVPFACTAAIPFVMNLSNVSLFTSMITGGGMLLAILFATYPVTPGLPRQRKLP